MGTYIKGRLLGWMILAGWLGLPLVVAYCNQSATVGEQLKTDAVESPRVVVPCEIVEVYDSDTITVRVTADIRVRLLDCWAPEIRTKDLAEKTRGEAARESLKSLARPGAKGSLSIPLDGVQRSGDLFTLGRLLARVSVQGKDLSDEQVRAGHATAEKAK